MALAAFAACTCRGESDNPVARRSTGFSFVNCGDIRAGCREGVREHHRFVQDAQYTKQLRTDDLVGAPRRDGNSLGVRRRRAAAGDARGASILGLARRRVVR